MKRKNNITISLIAALSQNRAIGKDNTLPWNIPEDMKRFRALTKGHIVIMGRKTFESIGRLLPERKNFIVSRDMNFKIKGADVFHSVEEALTSSKIKVKSLKLPGEIFIIGGGQIYSQAIKYADRLYLTIVKINFDGDAYFPDYSEFKKIVYKKESKDKNYNYTFLEVER